MAFDLIESAIASDTICMAIFENLITYEQAVMVHKILKGLCSENLKGMFTSRTQITKNDDTHLLH